MNPSLTDEMALAAKLKSLGHAVDAFTGLTTTEQRREIFRQAIRQVGPGLPIGNWNGMERTLGMVFQLVYGGERL
jgi:hypothetical protein